MGSLALPGLFSLKVSAGVTGDNKTIALLVIHRSMPRSLPSPQLSGSSTTLWQSRRPTCFVTMFGSSYQVKVIANLGVGVSYSLKTPLPKTGVEGAALSLTEMPLAASAGAATEGSYTYQSMKVYD